MMLPMAGRWARENDRTKNGSSAKKYSTKRKSNARRDDVVPILFTNIWNNEMNVTLLWNNIDIDEIPGCGMARKNKMNNDQHTRGCSFFVVRISSVKTMSYLGWTNSTLCAERTRCHSKSVRERHFFLWKTEQCYDIFITRMKWNKKKLLKYYFAENTWTCTICFSL